MRFVGRWVYTRPRFRSAPLLGLCLSDGLSASSSIPGKCTEGTDRASADYEPIEACECRNEHIPGSGSICNSDRGTRLLSTRHLRCEHALDIRGRSTRFSQGTRQDIEEYHRSVNICLGGLGSWEVVARSAALRYFACKDQWLWRYPRICYARPVASC